MLNMLASLILLNFSILAKFGRFQKYKKKHIERQFPELTEAEERQVKIFIIIV